MGRKNRSRPIVPEQIENSLIEEINAETDRGCAIVLTTMLDEDLNALLRRTIFRTPDGDKEREKVVDRLLLSEMAPFQSFYAKTETAFAIGCIGSGERDETHLVRQIRNEFAHNNRRDFDHAEIGRRISELADSHLENYKQIANETKLGRMGLAKYLADFQSMSNREKFENVVARLDWNFRHVIHSEDPWPPSGTVWELLNYGSRYAKRLGGK